MRSSFIALARGWRNLGARAALILMCWTDAVMSGPSSKKASVGLNSERRAIKEGFLESWRFFGQLSAEKRFRPWFFLAIDLKLTSTMPAAWTPKHSSTKIQNYVRL